MDRDVLHNMKDTPFNERETFNNAILLLSMVKSEYYYIVGFSRPDNKIEVCFDIEDKVYGQISESIIMDFSGDPKGIKVSARLTNIILDGENKILFPHKSHYNMDDGCVHYNRTFEKDSLIPESMEKLNEIILAAKKDVAEFINDGISEYLSNNKRRRRRGLSSSFYLKNENHNCL